MRVPSCVLLGAILLSQVAHGESHDHDADTSLDLVRDMLRDPDSVRFSDVRVFHDGSHIAVCGMVRAKNGFGGYGDPLRFVVLDNAETFLENPSDQGFGALPIIAAEFCK